MPYNPNIHHRRSIRLKDYDYSQAGLYFITICCQDKICRFGKIENGEMILNDWGEIARQCWLAIPQHFPNTILHEYVVMPNHVHGIIELVGAKFFSPLSPSISPSETISPKSCNNDNSRAKNFSPLPGTSRTIGSIIRGFKIGITKQLGFSIWQRNYYEHIIRNEQSYQNIAGYIIHNPEKWRDDRFYLE
ncbi:MAG: transposase [Bacteroidales bacterium]|jgi:REP element-mobilizing transposase RayT|nr:transposase [Bacteroidales bacterium]